MPASLRETARGFPKNKHREIPYDPAILLLKYMSKRTENTSPYENLYTHDHSNIIHNSPSVGTTQRSINS